MRTMLNLAAAAALTLAGALTAQAQDVPTPEGFPAGPIEINVVYPAGGGMDLNARILARAFEEQTGTTTIVNNRTGGAGLVGHTYLTTQAPKDGQTVGVVASLMFADALLRSEGAWSITDLEPIAYLNSDALVLATNASGPHAGKSLEDILGEAKAAPGTIRVATVPGSMFEYMLEQLEERAGVQFLKVPFQGGAPGVAALLGNNVDIAVAFFGEVRPHLDGERVQAVATTGARRTPGLDVPTLNEVLKAEDVIWQATRWVAVPKGVPEDRKAWLSEAFIRAANDPAVVEEYKAMGSTVDPSFTSAQMVAEHIARLAAVEEEFFRSSGRLK